MKTSRPWTKLVFAGAFTALALLSASSVTAHCRVWWQQRCCAQAGIDYIVCGTPPNQWRCAHSIVSDPVVGSLSAANAGWTGPWLAGFDTCTYYQAFCGGTPTLCIYAIPAVNATCTDTAPPNRPPNCDKCP